MYRVTATSRNGDDKSALAAGACCPESGGRVKPEPGSNVSVRTSATGEEADKRWERPNDFFAVQAALGWCHTFSNGPGAAINRTVY